MLVRSDFEPGFVGLNCLGVVALFGQCGPEIDQRREIAGMPFQILAIRGDGGVERLAGLMGGDSTLKESSGFWASTARQRRHTRTTLLNIDSLLYRERDPSSPWAEVA